MALSTEDVERINAIPFELPKLKQVCNRPIENFKGLGTVSTTKDGMYIYRNNGANVLAVAHLDTVQSNKGFDVVDRGKNGTLIYSPALDDRLGAYIILAVLPRMGINVDVLLTEGEETGRSTAAHFTAPEGKAYNWMFQFDRAGDDVVMYQYDNQANRDLVKAADLKPGNGSFSDICKLDNLKCSGFNFGCAYENNHSLWAYMDLWTCLKQIDGFRKFYEANKDTHLAYERSTARTYYPNSYGNNWDDYSNYRYSGGMRSLTSKDGKYVHERWDSKLGKWVPAEDKNTSPNVDETQPRRNGGAKVLDKETGKWVLLADLKQKTVSDTVADLTALADSDPQVFADLSEAARNSPDPATRLWWNALLERDYCDACGTHIQAAGREQLCHEDSGFCLKCYEGTYGIEYDDVGGPRDGFHDDQCDGCGQVIDVHDDDAIECYFDHGMCVVCFEKLAGEPYGRDNDKVKTDDDNDDDRSALNNGL